MYMDLHCDTVTECYEKKESLLKNELQLDLTRRVQAGGGLQCFAIYLNAGKLREDGTDIWEKTMDYMDYFDTQMRIHHPIVRQVRNKEEIDRCIKEGKLSALLTVEEGSCCKGRIENLRVLYNRGVRMMTLTWNETNMLGCSCMDSRDKGLTPLGIEFVEKMSELGILVDVSHLSDRGIDTIEEIVKGPYVASHSNCRAICNHPRNLTDDRIAAIGNHGGVIGLNLYDAFLGKDFLKLEDKECFQIIGAHVRHMIAKGGQEVIAFGSDFDGIPDNPLIPQVMGVPVLRDALHKQGISESVLDKMFFGNSYRVMAAL